MDKERYNDPTDHESGNPLAFVAEATRQVGIRYLTSSQAHDLLAHKFPWHTLFMHSVEAASTIAQLDIWPEVFNTYLILGSRWFSHHEAVEALLATGRYGDSMVLLRSLLEDTDLMTYFGCYPADAADWTERLSRAPVWSDQVYRKGFEKFRMRRVWEKLKAKGVEPVGERDYSILSATVHASPWGARFFGRTLPTDPSRVYLSFAPVYDPAASFLAGLVLQGTYPRPIEAFLAICDASTAPMSAWRSIKADYDVFIKGWQAKMEIYSRFRVAMADAEERVSRGEEPGVVLQDLAKLFEETHGQDTGSGAPPEGEEAL